MKHSVWEWWFIASLLSGFILFMISGWLSAPPNNWTMTLNGIWVAWMTNFVICIHVGVDSKPHHKRSTRSKPSILE